MYVYVRVNNRGVEPATNVSVSVYFASTTNVSPKAAQNFWELSKKQIESQYWSAGVFSPR